MMHGILHIIGQSSLADGHLILFFNLIADGQSSTCIALGAMASIILTFAEHAFVTVKADPHGQYLMVKEVAL